MNLALIVDILGVWGQKPMNADTNVDKSYEYAYVYVLLFS